MTSDLPSPDRSGIFNRVAIAFIVLSTVAVVVRFWSRAVAFRGYLGMDDWTCLLALMLSIGLCVVGIMWSHSGLGHHVVEVSPEEIERGLKLLYAGYYFFNVGLGVVKYSALFFYSRVFSTHNKRFNRAILFGHILVTGWLIFVIPSITFNCTPIHKFWQPQIDGFCLNTYGWYLASGIFDALLDVYVLVLPMPMLYKLHMKASRKWLVAGAFVCGYCALLASLGRLISIAILGPAINEDFTWNAVDVLLWSFVEPCIGLISICLPSWFYLFRRWQQDGAGSLFTFRQSSNLSPVRVIRGGPKPPDDPRGFKTLESQGKDSESIPLHNV